ncbi:3',5'-cyclic-AMP phosphodiesterase [Spongiibacter sp. KMU-158]|uniref:3',5'-cyclic-AMP phosphodiesterase n=1 Tax=Spongiibacter pelagi TaxID=2760804 RepID=A0A927BXR0_9GAMM|nr:3',5'-cyclic-AMP phosphodiesterase [Spongiibacter pelagi]MBD2857490.1 3',5'-cyclic-AMP phosphodiesterase [Spongiibacter pelagi]
MSSRPLKVVQISDCHLGASAEDALLGMNTEQSLDAVLDALRQHETAIDLIVVSGDLAADGEPEAYRRALAKLQGLAPQILWLPGNHDTPEVMREIAPEQMPLLADCGGWQIALLDSHVPGKVGGSLKPAELSQLAEQLSADKPALIFMHHHLLPVGCEWLDAQRIDNADLLLALAEQTPAVKAMVSGHVHQQWQQEFAHLQLLTSPSTCIQFAPKSKKFALEAINPGYRWFSLQADGGFDTGVVRVEGQTFHVDQQANGY